MPRTTLNEVNERLDQVIHDVEKKVDKEILVLELQAIKKDITTAQTELTRINAYGRWVIIFIAGALMTAILNLVIKK
jgi:hypothetical protein